MYLPFLGKQTWPSPSDFNEKNEYFSLAGKKLSLLGYEPSTSLEATFECCINCNTHSVGYEWSTGQSDSFKFIVSNLDKNAEFLISVLYPKFMHCSGSCCFVGFTVSDHYSSGCSSLMKENCMDKWMFQWSRASVTVGNKRHFFNLRVTDSL